MLAAAHPRHNLSAVAAPRRLARPSARVLLTAALAASSGLALTLLAARAGQTGHLSLRFLVWNLFLAWITFVLALVVDQVHGGGVTGQLTAVVVGGVWLLFFPNAPYLVTDLIHLTPNGTVPLWYDALLYSTFGFTVVLLGFSSLYLIQSSLRAHLGSRPAWSVTLLVLGLASYGVYVGRFLRWNSWDVARNPRLLARESLDRVLNPFSHQRTVLVTALFATFLVVTYLVFYAFAVLHAERTSPTRSPMTR